MPPNEQTSINRANPRRLLVNVFVEGYWHKVSFPYLGVWYHNSLRSTFTHVDGYPMRILL